MTRFLETAIGSTSISHGSHLDCESRSMTLKNPARCSLPARERYRAAPMPGVRTATSVTIHNWSSGLRSVMVRVCERTACAWLNEA